MPYANIHWIKLKLEILNDKRFIFDCTNDQKWLFIGLLLLAANTQNSISDDENYIKNRLNLPENAPKIRENLDHLFKTFPKLISKNGFIRFKNFNKLHNPLGNPLEIQRKSDGTPMDVIDKNRIDKNRIDKINKVITEYIIIKKFPTFLPDGSKDQALINSLWKRNVRVVHALLDLAKDKEEQVIEAIKWFGAICDKKGLSWSLETIEKWFPEFLVKGKINHYDNLLKEFNLKKV